MPTTLYEIVQLSNGDYALQRTDGGGEPLVRICFSKEARHYLQESSVEVARAMIDAGIEVVEQINEEEAMEQEVREESPRLLH
ncbi:hypothetical protein ACVBEJ_06445 [Porticoccus sp. GXU_MW_L64]